MLAGTIDAARPRYRAPLEPVARRIMPEGTTAVSAAQWVRAVDAWIRHMDFRRDLAENLAGAARVLATMAVPPHADMPTTTAPTRARLAAAMGVTERSVTRWWRRLEAAGLLLEVERGTLASLRQRRNVGGVLQPRNGINRACSVFALVAPTRVAEHPSIARGPEDHSEPVERYDVPDDLVDVPPHGDLQERPSKRKCHHPLHNPHGWSPKAAASKSDASPIRDHRAAVVPPEAMAVAAAIAAWPCWGRRLAEAEVAAIGRIVAEYAPGESAYAIGRRIEWPNHQMTATSPAGLLAYRLTHDQLGHEIRHSEAATYVTRPEREAWRRMRRDGRLPQQQQQRQQPQPPPPPTPRFEPEPEPTYTRRMTPEEIEAGRAADRAAAERLRVLQQQERQRQAEHMHRTRRAWSMPAPRPVDREAEEATRRASLAALEQMMARGM